MKIFVAGATGRVAHYLMKDLVAKGHKVLAGARQVERLETMPGMEPVTTDLTASVADLASLLTGVDVVYFTAGSRGKDLLQTDAYGAVKLAQAAELAGIKRYILLSSLDATQPDKWAPYEQSGLMNYIIAKYFADNFVIHQSHLDYTILQPTTLVEAKEADGLVSLGSLTAKTNTIPNVAKVLAELAEADHTIGKVITMSDGPVAVKQAVAVL